MSIKSYTKPKQTKPCYKYATRDASYYYSDIITKQTINDFTHNLNNFFKNMWQ